MEEKVKTYTLDEAKEKMERFCAYQERCHKEVVQKLRSMRMIPDAIDVIMVYLIQNNFLSEERFARSFARGKFHNKKWGRVRITRELKLRGITHFLIQEALEEIEEEYEDVFEELAEKKYDSIKEKNIMKARKKLADYLLYKGWESHLVYDKVTELYPFR
ncbi:MAG: regulatory protein RecX [Capnocytophaga sp.]|nr:regulatory protein RecX [Capnocytophaga sp.]